MHFIFDHIFLLPTVLRENKSNVKSEVLKTGVALINKPVPPSAPPPPSPLFRFYNDIC